MVITRVLVFVVGVLAVTWLPLTGDGARDAPLAAAKEAPIATLHSRWDTAWYAGIVVNGYQWDAARGKEVQQNVAFFPGFPLVTLGLQFATTHLYPKGFLGGDRYGRAEVTGVLVALFAFTAALMLLYRLAALDLPPPLCARAVVLCASYPFAFFFSVPYTESLFLMAVVGAFLSLRVRRVGWLIAFGFLAGITRQTGFLVALPLAIALAAETRSLRQRLGAWLGAFSPVAGGAAYSGFLWWKFGDPLAWVWAQAAWAPADRWRHILDADSFSQYLTTYPYDVANLLAVLVVVPLIWSSRRIHRAYWVFGVVTIVVPLVMDVTPLGRITSIIFPAFIALAAAPLRPGPFRILVVCWFLLQLVGAALFYGWRPLY